MKNLLLCTAMMMAVGNVANAAYDSVCPKKQDVIALFQVKAHVKSANKNIPFDFQARRVDGKGPFNFTAKDFKIYDHLHQFTWNDLHDDSTIVYDPTNQDPNICVAQIWYKQKMELSLNIKPEKYTGKKQ